MKQPKPCRRTDVKASIELAMPDGGSENIYRYMFDRLTEYAIFTISTTGAITWNSGAERTFGHTTHEAMGQHYGIFFTADDRAAGAPRCEINVANAEGRVDVDRWHVRKDGSQFLGNEYRTTVAG